MPNTVGEHGGTDVFDQFALQSNWNNFGVGDLDRSGVVDVFDLFIVLGDYGAAEPNGNISLPVEDNIHGYTGGIFDSETQIYLFRNRYYDPSLGRFLQRDPAGYVDGMNLYLYGLGNPLMFMDPLGLWGWGSDCWDGFLGLFGGSPLDRWTDNRAAVQANQEAHAERLAEAGLMSQSEADALMAANLESYDAIDSSVTDVHQARLDAAVAIASIPTGGAATAVLEIGSTAVNVAVDLSQGQTTQAVTNIVPGVGSAALKPVAGALGDAASTLLRQSADDLAAAAQKASDAIPGSGAARGSKVHKQFKDEVQEMGYGAEVSYKNGRVVGYGTKGSKRFDGVVGPAETPLAVADVKTGAARMTSSREAAMRANLPPGFQDIPFFVIPVP